MTALGKFLVFLTTTGAILLAVMSYSSWVTSYDFTDRTGKDGAPDGTFLALKQKIDAIQKSGQLGSMSKGYTDSVTELTLMEKNRTDADVFQTAQIVFLQTKATKALPVTEVIRTKNGVELNPNFTPKMTVAKNENILDPGKDRTMEAKANYPGQLIKKDSEIAVVHKVVIDETKKIVALSNEISNQGGQKGLVTRNAEELDKIALLNVELTAMRGNLINIAADLFMNQKRVKQLNDRVGELGKAR